MQSLVRSGQANWSTWLAAWLTLALPAATSLGQDAPSASAENLQFFEREVAPILKANCLSCHGGEAKVQGGLKLTSREDVLKGGESGPAVSLTAPDESTLLAAINYQSYEMPPKGKLPQAQIAVLTRWVKLGLPWPEDHRGNLVHRGAPVVDERARQFWAFKPVVRPPAPSVKNQAWVRNPIDAFILAKLEEKGLQPSPPAGRAALVRRVHYTLTGLPPVEETEGRRDKGTERESSQDDVEYAALIDRLLASRHYGEHWGRHWLDLVRYAETNSFERDNPKPFVWRYRDYVIQSFNDDKPYDQFIREQLAGDELDKVTPETIIATGYYRLGLWDDEPADPELAYYDGLDDIVATTGQTFLGLTVNCARCHDHKIDPFPQRDYYRLLAFFHGIRHYGERSDESVAAASLRSIATPEEEERFREVVNQYRERVAVVERQLREIEEPVQAKLPGGERDDFKNPRSRVAILRRHIGTLLTQDQFDAYAGLRKELERLQRERPKAAEQALAVKEHEQPRETYVLLRGNPQSRGERVEPGFPAVLEGAGYGVQGSEIHSVWGPRSAESSAIRNPQSALARRRVLAEWIASPQNPLTARAIVNRVWQYHFGRGIVRTSSNFGYQGAPPTHPELLDWLADWFVHDAGWSLKKLHRLILTSATYRQASNAEFGQASKAKFGVRNTESPPVDTPPPHSALRTPHTVDPENDLFWRFDLRRLSAEEIRDSILAVCGNLNRNKHSGPSVYPPISAEVLAGQSRPGYGWHTSPPAEAAARSVFVHVKRSLALPILAAFDAPDPDAPCPVRFATTQPTQALAMLNSEFLNAQAEVFARLTSLAAGSARDARVEFVLRRVLQRAPTPVEIDRGVRFIAAAEQTDELTSDEALRQFCLLALNLNEFVYLE